MNDNLCVEPACDEPAVGRWDFCEMHVPTCEICGGCIPYRLPGVRYSNCGSRRCENAYYED